MTLDFILDIERWGGGEPTAVGEGYSWMYQGRFHSVLYTRAGLYRGNHIHPNDQHTLLLKGKGRYIFKEDGENVDYHLDEEDCLTIEWWEGDFVAEEYDFPEFTVEINKRIEEIDRKVAELK